MLQDKKKNWFWFKITRNIISKNYEFCGCLQCAELNRSPVTLCFVLQVEPNYSYNVPRVDDSGAPLVDSVRSSLSMQTDRILLLSYCSGLCMKPRNLNAFREIIYCKQLCINNIINMINNLYVSKIMLYSL